MQVFLSHAPADEELAAKIASALEQNGFAVWDWTGILPGDDAYSAASKALETSELMVVLFSKGASQSRWVTKDVQYALTSGNYRGRVVPVLIDFVTFQAGKDVPWVLLKMDPIYLDRANAESRVAEIVARVSRIASQGANAS